MSAAAPTDVPPTDPAATTRGLVERQLAMLTRLAEIGMEIAEAAGRRARGLDEGDGAAADASDPAFSFSRAARAVRLTLALQSKLAEGLAALDRAGALARVGEAGRLRHRIHRRVEEAAEAEGCDGFEVERLSSGAWERLTEEDDAVILGRPIEEIVALVCRDLGLSPAFAAPAFAAPDVATPDVVTPVCVAPGFAAQDLPVNGEAPLPTPPGAPGWPARRGPVPRAGPFAARFDQGAAEPSP